jgi:hypothetical protein
MPLTRGDILFDFGVISAFNIDTQQCLNLGVAPISKLYNKPGKATNHKFWLYVTLGGSKAHKGVNS